MKELPQFSVEIIHKPSKRIEEEARRLSVGPQSLMGDLYALSGEKNEKGLYVPPAIAVVGDTAKNVIGSSIEDKKLARELGLPEDFLFNAGLFASHALRKRIRKEDATGPLLIQRANELVEEIHSELGLEEEVAKDPAARVTAYVAQAMLGLKKATFTGVGDVRVWVNGKHVVGIPEKKIDTAKADLVRNLTEVVWSSPVEKVEEIIQSFANEVGLDPATVRELKMQIFDVRDLSESAQDKQVIYRIVDQIVTPWHIRNLQNPKQGVDDSGYYYGAIDGSKTPERFIETVEIPTKNIDSIVIATDGMRECTSDGHVASLRDLGPVNTEFGEQTAVVLHRQK